MGMWRLWWVPALGVLGGGVTGGCAGGNGYQRSHRHRPAVVHAASETTPVPSIEDAADDPAIWIHPRVPGESLVIGTDKGGGLATYRLDGTQVEYRADGRMNNVDIRQGVRFWGRDVDLVAASVRQEAAIALYLIDPDSGRLVPAGRIPTGLADAYGVCLFVSPGDRRVYALVNAQDGTILQFALSEQDPVSGPESAAVSPPPAILNGTEVRRFRVESQPEGMVCDDAHARLFVGEEAVGVWRFGAEPGDQRAPVLVAGAGGDGPLRPDVEGLAIIPTSMDDGWLIVSSQGNSRFVVYDRRPPHALRLVFEVGDARIDGVSETDGIDATSAPLGAAFPRGIFVAQDGLNTGAGGEENQNFKIVDWRDIERALAERAAGIPPR